MDYSLTLQGVASPMVDAKHEVAGNSGSQARVATPEPIGIDRPSELEHVSDYQDAGSATLLSQAHDLSQITDCLLVPRDWAGEASMHPQLDNVMIFLSRLSPTALSVPWLITSMTKDLSGAERVDSKDHQDGLAIDIAPMMQRDVILPEEPPIPGLAWNIKNMILLSQGQWGDMPLFVEGDHVHFSSNIKPDERGALPLMWSDSMAYPSIQLQERDAILSKLRNSFWRWTTATLTLEPPSMRLQQYMKTLLMPEASSGAVGSI